MLEPRIKNADVIRAYFGLLVLGRTVFEDIELFCERVVLREQIFSARAGDHTRAVGGDIAAASGWFERVIRRDDQGGEHGDVENGDI